MESLIRLYIDLEKEIAFLYGPAAEKATPIEFERVSKVIRHLVECRANLKNACDRMSDGYSGEMLDKYVDVVCWGRWQDYA